MFIVIVNLSFGNPAISPTGQMSYTRRAGPILKFIYNGTPLQYSCLENPMDGGAWKAAVHGVTEGRTRLSDFTFMHWRRKWQPTAVAWRIPETGEPGGLPSMGSHRVEHD